MKKIITTVGTSVFTNITSRTANRTISDLYKRLEKEPSANWEKQKVRIEQLRKATKEAWLKKPNDSAEIKSICAIARELKQDVEVYLLATDTVLSVLACLLIMEWFDSNKSQCPATVTFKVADKNGKDICLTANNRETLTGELVVKNLRVISDSSSSSADNIDDATIDSGFLNLIDKIQAIIKPGQKKRDGFILNISGGYKAFIPILTIMGQLYDIPLKYIYEGSDRLVSIGQFPINFDWGIVDLFVPYLNDLPGVQPSENIVEQLKEFHLVVADKENKYVRSSMGELLKGFYDTPNRMPTSKTVVGHYVEYKLYEYFHRYYHYCGVLGTIERSVSLENSGQTAEIDLQLTSPEGEVFACEVKSFLQVQTNFKGNILKPANDRVQLYKNKGKTLKWYILIFYKLEGQSVTAIVKDLKNLKSDLSKEGVAFKACYLDLPLKNNRINYQSFVQHALEREKLKEIDLNKSTSSNIVEDTFKLY